MAQTEITTERRRGRAELIAALAASRDGIAADSGELADLVNVPQRIRRSLKDTPVKRAATALAAGFISSKLLSKKRRSTKQRNPGWLHRTFPDLDFKKIVTLLLKSYLEPETIDLRALLRERLRDYLK